MIKSKEKSLNGYIGHEVEIETKGPEAFCKEIHDVIMAYTQGDKEKAVIVLQVVTALLEGSSLNYMEKR